MKKANWFILALIAWPWAAFGQSTQPGLKAKPEIILNSDVEDGKKMIRAVVTLSGKPMENVTLQYLIKRTFGDLPIGEDTTLDDGTSAVAFPSDLPGDSANRLCAIARIKTPAQYSAIFASATFAADQPGASTGQNFSRALWAPHAPFALMLSIFVVVGAVWISYFFVIGQILAIRNGR